MEVRRGFPSDEFLVRNKAKIKFEEVTLLPALKQLNALWPDTLCGHRN